jgi:AcrR family transcriptional regulator
VLAAAHAVFSRKGLRGASLEEIAAEAGVSRGAVYYNFADKERLFLTLLRQRCQQRAEQIRRLAVESDEVGADIRRVATAFIDDARRDPGWTRLFVEFTALAAERPEIRAELAKELHDCRQAVAELLERRLRDLDIASQPLTRDLAAGAIALANGLALEHLADPALPNDLLPRLIELIIAGLQATKHVPPPAE